MAGTKTLSEIQDIVKWWIDLPADFNELTLLMWNTQRLSGLLFTLGSDMAESRKAWAIAKSLYEKEVKRLKVKFELTRSSSQAETQSRANTAELYEVENKAEAIYFGIKHQFDAVMEILEVMRQRIAVLRKEWELKNYAG